MQWEYKNDRKYLGGVAPAITMEMENLLNMHGEEGWELVSALRDGSTTPPSVLLFFKRPKIKAKAKRRAHPSL